MRLGWLLALAVSGCTNVIGAEFGDDYRVEPSDNKGGGGGKSGNASSTGGTGVGGRAGTGEPGGADAGGGQGGTKADAGVAGASGEEAGAGQGGIGDGGTGGAGPTCGDGKKEGSEACDGSDVGVSTCVSEVGNGSTGSVACKGDCSLDVSQCSAPPGCGNGVVEPDEDCDDAISPGAPGGGCSKFCKIEPGVGDLVITEIMYNPNAAPTSGSTELGEWFEVYNASPKTYDVRGLQLVSKTAGELHVIDSASPLLIAPGAYATFARGANASETTGFEPFYTYDSKLNFSNSSADRIHLEIGTIPPILIDGVDYTPSSNYNGKSYSLNPTKLTAVDNDSSSNFCVSKTEFGNPDGVGTKDKGTPGAPNDTCL